MSDMENKKRLSDSPQQTGTTWTFLTNHTHVLVCLTQDPETRLRDVAERVGITERAVQRIVADLEQDGILERNRDGRRNRYTIHPNHPLRHPVEQHCTVGDLLRVVLSQLPEYAAEGKQEDTTESG